MKHNKTKILISGGGTGGHVFPAISIANALRQQDPDVDILFVGALGRIEMDKVPQAGYKIVGLPVAGFQRSLTPKNMVVVYKLLKSLLLSRKIIRDFNPDAAVGVGGYASGPVLRVAQKKNVPVFLQEQNSFAGVTNRLLAKKAKKIYVAYEGMDKYFEKEKIILTGNPVRQAILDPLPGKKEGFEYLGVGGNRPVVLLLGGSGGARTINESVINQLELIAKSPVDVVLQSGKYYFEKVNAALEGKNIPNLKVFDFITDMAKAYAAADVIISRAGAGTISELCIVGKPVILVPSPHVAEDHQTKNAMALVEKEAAMLITDANAVNNLLPQAIELAGNAEKKNLLGINIKKMEKRSAGTDIALDILKTIGKA